MKDATSLLLQKVRNLYEILFIGRFSSADFLVSAGGWRRLRCRSQSSARQCCALPKIASRFYGAAPQPQTARLNNIRRTSSGCAPKTDFDLYQIYIYSRKVHTGTRKHKKMKNTVIIFFLFAYFINSHTNHIDYSAADNEKN